MDPKLAMLFVLFAGIIGLSHLTDERLDKVKRQLTPRRWRSGMPSPRKN